MNKPQKRRPKTIYQKKPHLPAYQWIHQKQTLFSAAINRVVFFSVMVQLSHIISFYIVSYGLYYIIIESQLPGHNLIGLLCLVYCVQLLLRLIQQRNRNNLSNQVINHFQAIFHQQLSLHAQAIIREHSTAAWQSFFLNRLPAIQNYYSFYTPQKYLAITLPVVVVITIFPFSWLAALIIVITAPLIPLFMWLTGKGASAEHARHFHAMERLSGLFLDRLKARQLIHLHQALKSEVSNFVTATEELKIRTLAVLRMAFLSSSVLDFFSTLAIALVAVFIGFSLLGEITFGAWSKLYLQESLFILLITPLFFNELKTLGRYYHLKAEAEGAALDIASLVDDDSPNFSTSNSLHWKNVDIYADRQSKILHIDTLTFNQGERILLKGASGTGKTTLLEAILGLRLVQTHSSLQVIKKEDVAWLNQSAVILPETIKYNLTLGNNIPDEKLLAALEKVKLLEWLKKIPGELNCHLGNHPPMSGGQLQRLAIARLLLIDKPVIFLDEPTAHLPIEQQSNIRRLLQVLLGNKTLIWIDHTISEDRFFTNTWHISAGKLHIA